MFPKFQQNDWQRVDIWVPPSHWHFSLHSFIEHFPLAFKDFNDWVSGHSAASLEFHQKQCQCSFWNTWSLLLVLTTPSLSPSWTACVVSNVMVSDGPRTWATTFWHATAISLVTWFSFKWKRYTQAVYRSRCKLPNSPPFFIVLPLKKVQCIFWVYSEQIQGKTRKENCQIRENVINYLYNPIR